MYEGVDPNLVAGLGIILLFDGLYGNLNSSVYFYISGKNDLIAKIYDLPGYVFY